MMFDLTGQTVVVVGGAKRIGREIVLQHARWGAHVAFSFRSSGAEAEQLLAELRADFPGARFNAFPLELGDAAQTARFAEQIWNEFPNVRGLVNCAAIFRRTPVETLCEADFDDHILANLKGPFLLSQNFGQRFWNGDGGAILNFSDIYAQKPLANYIPYCISKSGVETLTRTLAKALAPRVRVNCIAPGTILPPSETQGDPSEDETEALLRRIPFGRFGTPEEVAGAAGFLLWGPQFISGVILPVDGGQILR